MEPDIEEVAQEAQGGNGGGNGDGGGDGGASGMFETVPTFGLSKRQLLILAAVVVVAVAWYLRSSPSESSVDLSGSGGGTSAVEDAQDMDLGDVSVETDDDLESDEAEIRLPADADDDLAGDEAIIEYFKDAGHISGEDGE